MRLKHLLLISLMSGLVFSTGCGGEPASPDVPTSDAGTDADTTLRDGSPADEKMPSSTFERHPDADALLEERQKTLEEGVEVEFIADANSPDEVTFFHRNKVLVSSFSAEDVEAMAARWDGEIVDVIDFETPDIENTYSVRISLENAPIDQLEELLKETVPDVRGDLLFSSERALALFAIAAWEHKHHNMKVSPDVLFDLSDEMTETEKKIAEGVVGNEDYFAQDSVHQLNVKEAWQLLLAHDKIKNKVKIMIADGGFATPENADIYPEDRRIFGGFNQPNPNKCGARVRAPSCKWHGTNVVAAAMGSLNGNVTGPAAPVAELVAVNKSDFKALLLFVRYALLGPALQRPQIVSISSSAKLPAPLSFFADIALDKLGNLARKRNTLIFSSAGNRKENVDHRSSFLGFSWESSTTYPCETEGVICVGATNHQNTELAKEYSSYGTDRDGGGTVEIYATPGNGYTLDEDGQLGGGRFEKKWGPIYGTSFSTPLTAGIAALVWAANPSLTAGQVTHCLLDRANQGGVHDRVSYNRRPNALESVKCALEQNGPIAAARILAPSDGEYLDGRQKLYGIAVDANGLSQDFSWSTNKGWSDTPTRATEAIFASLPHGNQTLTLSSVAADSSIDVNVKNYAPRVTPLIPLPHYRVYQNESVPLIATMYDSDPLKASFTLFDTRRQFLEPVVPKKAPRSYYYKTYQTNMQQEGYRGVMMSADDGDLRTTKMTAFSVDPKPPENRTPPVFDMVSPAEFTALDPANGRYLKWGGRYDNEPFEFKARASDLEDGELDGSAFVWYATNLETRERILLCDGNARDCSSLSTTLEYGKYDVTVEAIDSDGYTRQAHLLFEHVPPIE